MRFLATILAFFIFSFNLSALNATADGTVREPKVYITQTGNHYHSKDCHYLRSKIAIGLYQAQERGYSACSYCGGEPDGWDYFPESEYYPTAPDEPNAGGGTSTDNQSGAQESDGGDGISWFWIIVIGAVVVLFIYSEFISKPKNK